MHLNSGATFGVAGPKGVSNPNMVQAVTNIFDCWGIQEVTFMTDQEPSAYALAAEARAKRTGRTLIQVAPKTSHASVGGVERANREMGKQVRALKLPWRPGSEPSPRATTSGIGVSGMQVGC